MSSSSEEEEAAEDSSHPSEFSDDDEGASDQEGDGSRCTEKWEQDRGERKMISRTKIENTRKRKREDRIFVEEETDQEEEGGPSCSIQEKEREEERRKKGVVGSQSSEIVPGIVYLSRVPPFMKPHKVKHLLSHYGSVGRVYLKPEGQ